MLYYMVKSKEGNCIRDILLFYLKLYSSLGRCLLYFSMMFGYVRGCYRRRHLECTIISQGENPDVKYAQVYIRGVPVRRAAHRREPNSWFRPLKSLFRDSMKLLSFCHCSIAISPSGHQSATRCTVVFVKLSIISLAPSIDAPIAPP